MNSAIRAVIAPIKRKVIAPFKRNFKYPWLPHWVQVSRETDVHPHVREERGELFEAYNTGTTELDLLNWLHATVRVLKPDAVLETGAANGIGTTALASACRLNGFGKIHSVELDPDLCSRLDGLLKHLGLRDFVEIHCEDSIQFLARNTTPFDVGFFDSMCEIRASEFSTCLERGTIRKPAVFHDTSARRCETMKGWPRDELHLKYRADLQALAKDPRCSGYFESPLSRGFVCLFLMPA
jgi:hypothetical protein